MTRRSVKIVIVAYGGSSQLDSCLRALGGSSVVTVLDNSSAPAVAAVASAHGASYDDPGVNLGFAAGVNRALRPILTGPPADVLLLNPDATIAYEGVETLSNFLHQSANDRVGAVAPRLLDDEQRQQRTVWPFPNPVRCWAEAAGLGTLPAERTFVVGAVMLLRWEALKDVGLFDERFFLYAEEADWQRRALYSGWRATVCNDVVATHVGGGSAPDRHRRDVLFHAGQETYIRKWYGRSGWWSYRSAACVGATARALMLTGQRRSDAARRAVLYARGPRRVAGFTS